MDQEFLIFKMGVTLLIKVSKFEIYIFLLLFYSANFLEYIDNSSNYFLRLTVAQAFSNYYIRLKEPNAMRSALCCYKNSQPPFSFAYFTLLS
jgi:hypothetical protein